MQELTTAQRKAIDYVLDEFDFEKVHRIMKLLDWKWWEGDAAYKLFSIPTIPRLRKTAREALMMVEEGGMGGTGGFIAMKHGDYYRLIFELEAADNYE